MLSNLICSRRENGKKCECWHNSSRQNYKTNLHLDWNKSKELRGETFATAQLKMVKWIKIPCLTKDHCFRCRSPFSDLQTLWGLRRTTEVSREHLLLCSAHSSVEADEISLKYIHKNILSYPKYETQSVHNYTSLSCPNRAWNVEYASTNYNDLRLVRNITK